MMVLDHLDLENKTLPTLFIKMQKKLASLGGVANYFQYMSG